MDKLALDTLVRIADAQEAQVAALADMATTERLHFELYKSCVMRAMAEHAKSKRAQGEAEKRAKDLYDAIMREDARREFQFDYTKTMLGLQVPDSVPDDL